MTCTFYSIRMTAVWSVTHCMYSMTFHQTAYLKFPMDSGKKSNSINLPQTVIFFKFVLWNVNC